MKRHHAAALALVGWYLMTAPVIHEATGKWKSDKQAPLSQWQRNPVIFDCKSDCERMRDYDLYKRDS
jgi:hypothetical protein